MFLLSRSSSIRTPCASPHEARIFFASSDKSSMHTINLRGVFRAIFKRVGMWPFVTKMTVICAWLILMYTSDQLYGENGECSHMYSRRMSVEERNMWLANAYRPNLCLKFRKGWLLLSYSFAKQRQWSAILGPKNDQDVFNRWQTN